MLLLTKIEARFKQGRQGRLALAELREDFGLFEPPSGNRRAEANRVFEGGQHRAVGRLATIAGQLRYSAYRSPRCRDTKYKMDMLGNQTCRTQEPSCFMQGVLDKLSSCTENGGCCTWSRSIKDDVIFIVRFKKLERNFTSLSPS